ncbi:alpha/beta fold hydrolase [Candidatus Woesearchaeota archaeon]|nr:alpha/beta fold hydrolase [Candidatus Woesearchaeota archaeon]
MGVLSGFDKPFLFRYSYYLDSVLGEDKISNEASISEYSERLDFFIDNVLNLTGANKVDILAHSMGGLVSRKYVLDNGPEKINNMILVGTPNNGITKTISNVCPVFGSKRECDEMKKDSDFILALNSNVNNTLVDNTYLFGGVGCFLDGFASDGVVILPNLNLTGVPLILINMSCSKMNFIHNDLLNPEIFPSIYTSIENILFE